MRGCVDGARLGRAESLDVFSLRGDVFAGADFFRKYVSSLLVCLIGCILTILFSLTVYCKTTNPM